MTISTTTSRAQYAGNGVTTIFSFPYRFLANGDLEVTLFDAAGTPDPQALTTDYTVLGADNDAGGSVTMLVAPAVGETLVIRRVVALTQETDYISGDSFPAETHERALDRLTMADQQLQEQVDRSITLPLDDETFSGALPAIVASRFLRVNDTGTALELVEVVDVGELVVSPFIETLLDDANAAAARTTLGAQVAGNYAASGANSDITSLSGLTTLLTKVQGGTGVADGSNLYDTGDIKISVRTTAPAGWVKGNGQTIGNASSGGTGRANADTEALFTLLWNETTQATLPIQTSAGGASTRGASAAADFAADKRMPLPDFRGEAIRGLDDGRGVDAARANLSSQLDAGQGHFHAVTELAGTGSLNGFGGSVGNGAATITPPPYGATTMVTDGTNGTPRIAAETRMRNVAASVYIKL